MLRIAVMASGGGTNLQQLLDTFPQGGGVVPAEIALVVSNRHDAGALERAVRAGVKTGVIDPDRYESPEDAGEAHVELFGRESIGLIVLAGYLKLLPANLVRAYSNRIINIHPALLPSFGGRGMYGMRVHRAVIESGVKLTGPTVHFVNEQYDKGPIIAQTAVPVGHSDTPEEIAARVLEQEHRILPRVVELIALGKVEVVDGRVHVYEELKLL